MTSQANSCKTACKRNPGFSLVNKVHVMADKFLAALGWPFADLSCFHQCLIMDILTELTMKKAKKKKVVAL